MSQSRLVAFSVIKGDLIIKAYHSTEYHVEYNKQKIHSQSCRIDISNKFGKHIASHKIYLDANSVLNKVSVLEFPSKMGFIILCSSNNETNFSAFKLTNLLDPSFFNFPRYRISNRVHLTILPDTQNPQDASLNLDLVVACNRRIRIYNMRDDNLLIESKSESELKSDIKGLQALPDGRIVTLHNEGVFAWNLRPFESSQCIPLKLSHSGVEPKCLCISHPHESFILFAEEEVTRLITDPGLPGTGRYKHRETRPEKGIYSWLKNFECAGTIEDIDHDVDSLIAFSDASLAALYTRQNKSAITIYKTHDKKTEYLFSEKLMGIAVLSNDILVTCSIDGKLNYFNTHRSQYLEQIKNCFSEIQTKNNIMLKPSIIHLITGYLGFFQPGPELENERKNDQLPEALENEDLPRRFCDGPECVIL